MPGAAQDIHDSKDLEGRVGALLDDMQAGTQHLAAEAARPPPAARPPVPPPPAPAAENGQDATLDADLANAVAALAGEPASPVAQGPTGSADTVAPPPASVAPAPPAREPAAPAASAPAADTDLAAAVEKLMEEPAKAPGAPTGASPERNGKADSLDAELAGLADELIAGEFADESAVMKDEKAAPPPPVNLPPSAASATERGGTVQRSAHPEPHGPEAGAMSPTELKPRPEPPTPKEPADKAPATRKKMAAFAGQAAKRAAGGGAAARPLVLKLLAAISAPVQSRPHLRDTLGYVALVQGFLALCVWVYVMFIRSDKPFDPPPPTPAKETAAEEGGHSEGHDAAKAGHQAKKAKKPAKKTTHASAEGGHH